MKSPIRIIKAKLQARKNRRTAVKMMVFSGVLRHASHSIRYGMSKRELELMLREEDIT